MLICFIFSSDIFIPFGYVEMLRGTRDPDTVRGRAGGHCRELGAGDQVAIMALWGMDGMLSRSIFQHIIRLNIIDDNPKISIYRPGTLYRGIPVTMR